MTQIALVDSGNTSVSLNLPLLELAAEITLVSADTDGEAFSEEFPLGFPIVEDTDFSFETEPFTPLGGTIQHSGTVTLDLSGQEVTVGDFSIGFDPARVSNTASGFFISDTTDDVLDLEILFDISGTGDTSIEDGLTISEADLLVAPELADALGSASLSGADVGDARIDAATSITENTDDEAAEAIEPIDGEINFNFGVPRADAPEGFIQDIGEAYDPDLGYGWVTEDSAGTADLTPIDIVVNGRDRDTLLTDESEQPLTDSLIHMQYPTGLPRSGQSVTTPAAWEYELANGQYEVTVGVGDPEFFDSAHVINIEGENLISEFIPTGSESIPTGSDITGDLPLGAQAFTEATGVFEVTDGSLTVDAIGGENTKINYISIVSVDDI
ncbi:MAG: hypothetical protein AAFQ41_05510 [Cyanobacteria bacterium J06623_7]